MKKLLPAFLLSLILSTFLISYTFSLTPSVAHAAARLQMPSNYLVTGPALFDSIVYRV